jgi:hypothetical protein
MTTLPISRAILGAVLIPESSPTHETIVYKKERALNQRPSIHSQGVMVHRMHGQSSIYAEIGRQFDAPHSLLAAIQFGQGLRATTGSRYLPGATGGSFF